MNWRFPRCWHENAGKGILGSTLTPYKPFADRFGSPERAFLGPHFEFQNSFTCHGQGSRGKKWKAGSGFGTRSPKCSDEAAWGFGQLITLTHFVGQSLFRFSSMFIFYCDFPPWHSIRSILVFLCAERGVGSRRFLEAKSTFREAAGGWPFAGVYLNNGPILSKSHFRPQKRVNWGIQRFPFNHYTWRGGGEGMGDNVEQIQGIRKSFLGAFLGYVHVLRCPPLQFSLGVQREARIRGPNLI